MPNSPNVFLFNLGCPKARVDSERMLGQIVQAGGRVCHDLGAADMILVNTCGFIQDAIEESVQAIGEAVARKEAGECRTVVVVGCLAQRYGRELRRQLPGVDAWVGVNEEGRIAELCRAAGTRRPTAPGRLCITRHPAADPVSAPRRRAAPRHYAYLKISEGCDNVCSFCIIPRIRGRHRSRPRGELVREAEELAQDGAVELILVAQDTTDYGRDLDGTRQIAHLLRDLAHVDGIRWLRLLYAFPAHVDDHLIDEIAANDKVCKYLDVPIQHIHSTVLKRMRREVGRKETELLLHQLRSRVPGIVLRTSVIVGFPGETEAQFRDLLDFLDTVRFERLGAFRYSHEEGTAAHRYADQVPDEVKHERYHRVMSLQQEIAFDHARRTVGRRIDVLVDRKAAGKHGLWEGRSCGEAPEIDGLIHLRGRHIQVGNFYPCDVVSAAGYDLRAVPADPHLRTRRPLP